MEQARAVKTNFRGADLSYAVGRRADFRGADFRGAKVFRLDLHGAETDLAHWDIAAQAECLPHDPARHIAETYDPVKIYQQNHPRKVP